MAIKSDRWIRKMALEHDMISPFNEKQVREGVISYGLSSYGYDLRVAEEVPAEPVGGTETRKTRSVAVVTVVSKSYADVVALVREPLEPHRVVGAERGQLLPGVLGEVEIGLRV